MPIESMLMPKSSYCAFLTSIRASGAWHVANGSEPSSCIWAYASMSSMFEVSEPAGR